MSLGDWWRGAIVYQVYLPSFLDGNGDGFGDLVGLADHFEYIEDLGVDAVWISPFYRSPFRDGGYDVSDHRSVDERFGTMEDFDRVVAKAHEAGIRIIIDQVWSHTSSDHAWFAESRVSRDGAKSDWYVWADPREDGSQPNNWLSVFGGSAWQWGAERRQYYLHHFLAGQPKLNLRNPEVVREHLATAEYWLRRGVDGFRLDAVDFMLHDPALQNNPPRHGLVTEVPWNPFRMQRHDWDMCHPDTDALLREIRKFLAPYPQVTTIGEISSEPGALSRIGTFTTAGGLHMAYTLGTMKAALSPSMMRQVLEEARELNKTGCLCWSFSNHDVDRVATRWNPSHSGRSEFVRMLLVLLFCLPGSVCLYQGEELGLGNGRVPKARMQDPFGQTFYPAFSGRDGSRTPLPWVAGARNAGFSTAAETWLPVDPDHDTLAIDRQQADARSHLHFSRRLSAWRRQHPALSVGGIEVLEVPPPTIAFVRERDDDRILIVCNLSAAAMSLPLRLLPDFIADDPTGFSAPCDPDAVLLPPHGFILGRV